MNKFSNAHRVVSNAQSQPVSLMSSARDSKLLGSSESKILKVNVNEYQDQPSVPNKKEREMQEAHQQIIQQSYYAAVQTERFPNNADYFSMTSDRK